MGIGYYRGMDGKWYWHITAKNGKVIADSGQGYASRGNVLRAINRFRDLVKYSVYITVKEAP